MNFLFAISRHAFLLATFRHTGAGLPQKTGACFTAILLACAMAFALAVSPQTGVAKLLVWSFVTYLMPVPVVVAWALIHAFLSVFAGLVGMNEAVRDFWGFTAWILASVRIVKG